MALGMPDGIRGCLFDMDGVLTRTATLHAAAWKQMFDEFLADWADRTGENMRPFDAESDYDRYVDGRSRADGTRAFLDSRGIHLPDGEELAQRALLLVLHAHLLDRQPAMNAAVELHHHAAAGLMQPKGLAKRGRNRIESNNCWGGWKGSCFGLQKKTPKKITKKIFFFFFIFLFNDGKNY